MSISQPCGRAHDCFHAMRHALAFRHADNSVALRVSCPSAGVYALTVCLAVDEHDPRVEHGVELLISVMAQPPTQSGVW